MTAEKNNRHGTANQKASPEIEIKEKPTERAFCITWGAQTDAWSLTLGKLADQASGSMPTLRSRDCVGIEPQGIEFASGPGRRLGTKRRSRTTRQLRFGIAVAVPFISCGADNALAKELPDDSFASLSPGISREKPNREYNGLPMGGWMFYPGLMAGVVFDDNIFQTPTNRVARFGARIVPTVLAVRDEGIHQLTVYGTADARMYSGVSEADSVTARAGFSHKYEAMRDLVFRFQGDYTRQTDPFNAAGGLNYNAATTNPFSTSPIVNPFSYNQFIGSAVVVKMFNESFLSLRGSIAHITYDNSTGLAGSTSTAPPDGSIYAVTGRAGYWVSPLFYAYVEPTLDWRRYSVTTSNSNGYRVVGGLATNRLGLYRGEIFAGYQAQRSDQAVLASPSASSSISSTVLGGRLSYEPTRFLTIRALLDETLGISQVTDASAPPGTSTRMTTAMLQVDYAMSRVWTVSGRLGYINTLFVTGLTDPRHDNSWLAGIKYNYVFSPNFGLTLDYQYINLDSNVPMVGLTRNLVTLSGTYKY
jgi:hypothetical protein